MSAQERLYNFGLLDDIHNLFPEILYDSQLFPADSTSPLSWIRYRMTQLFPQSFRRGRMNYELRNQINVRADYDEWLFLTRLRPPAQIRMPPYRNEFVNTIPLFNNNNTIPLYNNIHSNTIPPLQAPPNYRIWGGEDNLSLLGLSLTLPAVENWLAGFLDAVPVRPTAQEIDQGSQILQSTSVGDDVLCTICQEHDQSPRAESVWRKINSCSHLFHRSCIDRWFTRNSHCPVCRYDIRALPPVNPAVVPSSLEEDSPM